MIEKTFELPAGSFDMQKSGNCGQAFRWNQDLDLWRGISKDKPVSVKHTNDLLEIKCYEDDIDYWINYLSLNEDYSAVEKILEGLDGFDRIVEVSKGIRVFNQEPFETTISFIISANNNVSRITKIIEKLCENIGEKLFFDERQVYAFPTPRAIADCSEEDMKSFGAGYRAPYIIKSASMIVDGFSLDELSKCDYAVAKKKIQDLPGVGPKVADCVLLFSLGFGEAYPMDVWMKRISMQMFPGVAENTAVAKARKIFGNKAGAAQQYLFHYARETGLGK